MCMESCSSVTNPTLAVKRIVISYWGAVAYRATHSPIALTRGTGTLNQSAELLAAKDAPNQGTNRK